MDNKDDNRSTNELSRSSSQEQRKLASVKTEESQFDPIKSFSKRGETSYKRSSACLDGSLTLKTEDPYVLMQTEMPEKKTCEEPHGTVEIWRGNVVGREAKELFEAVEHRYPNTFQRVQIRVTPFWLGNLKELHATIKRFMGLTVDTLAQEQITGLWQDFKDLEALGFDLSWAHKRLNMVARLKFGNEPLQKELMVLEHSLGPLKERVDEIMKQLLKAHDMYMKALSEYEDATKARNKKVEEMTRVFGPDFHRVLQDRLGYETKTYRPCELVGPHST
ncbi:hypothetical protein Lser_V15G01709 [Lactuca serriola]